MAWLINNHQGILVLLVLYIRSFLDHDNGIICLISNAEIVLGTWINRILESEDVLASFFPNIDQLFVTDDQVPLPADMLDPMLGVPGLQ